MRFPLAQQISSPVQYGGHSLFLHGPILRMQRILGAIELDDVFLPFRQLRRVFFASAEVGQGFLGFSRSQTSADGAAVLGPVGFNATQFGGMAFEISSSLDSGHANLLSDDGCGGAGRGGRRCRARGGSLEGGRIFRRGLWETVG